MIRAVALTFAHAGVVWAFAAIAVWMLGGSAWSAFAGAVVSTLVGAAYGVVLDSEEA